MPRFIFSKLVRDNIVQLCVDDPLVPHVEYRTLAIEDLKQALKNKLYEEAEEIPVRETADEEVVSEIADLQTVIDTLREVYGLSEDDIKSAQTAKNRQKGAFDSRHFIEYVDCDESSKWTAYFRTYPDKYPEVGRDA